MPRKTDSKNPADWIRIAASDLNLVRLAVQNEVSYEAARSKLAEILEKVLKAELIRTGWELEKTHDLDRLLQSLVERSSDLQLCSPGSRYTEKRFTESWSIAKTRRSC